MDMVRGHILCCGGTGCTSSGCEAIIKEMEAQLVANGLDKEFKVIKTGCFGLCALGPIIVVYPEGAFYSRVKVEDVKEIVDFGEWYHIFFYPVNINLKALRQQRLCL